MIFIICWSLLCSTHSTNNIFYISSQNFCYEWILSIFITSPSSDKVKDFKVFFYHLMLLPLCTLDVLSTLNTHYLQNPWTCENTQTSDATFVIKLNICFKVVPMPCPNCLLLSLCIIKYRVPAVLFIKHIKTALNCLKYVHYIFLIDMLYLCYTK